MKILVVNLLYIKMSNTYKHKDKGKYHNKVLKYNDVCEATKNMWDRRNSDISEDKQNILAK
jgi:hypothetical protein